MRGAFKYSVVFNKKVRKSLTKVPQNIRDKFFMLAEQLEEQGPIAANWQNYSKLGQNEYIIVTLDILGWHAGYMKKAL
jgi:mRNA-degrading endonuclease RelE of RelBE toxin-antitoxin system